MIELFQQLEAEGGSRMEIWEKLEKRTGYSRQYITRVLRQKGINYSRQSNEQIKHKQDMKIKKLTITNFKGIKHFEMDADL
ncbi:MAG: hypothetical protein K6G31_04470 [Paludibacteraceae bacterium]|nr:hypothetical protein [Paludibacteraceae bacterium]